MTPRKLKAPPPTSTPEGWEFYDQVPMEGGRSKNVVLYIGQLIKVQGVAGELTFRGLVVTPSSAWVNASGPQGMRSVDPGRVTMKVKYSGTYTIVVPAHS